MVRHNTIGQNTVRTNVVGHNTVRHNTSDLVSVHWTATVTVGGAQPDIGTRSLAGTNRLLRVIHLGPRSPIVRATHHLVHVPAIQDNSLEVSVERFASPGLCNHIRALPETENIIITLFRRCPQALLAINSEPTLEATQPFWLSNN
ncbi:hypothetical protein RRG08_048033 [Elysia crispata]|uniref:Uncharacterized protein n=1 Tax=Elysia crispata TaxID=231223 RepID=A0AAE1D8Q8_9GAST|nr:hypothetical protein RRG08_048033 [Elysia crispata]